MAKSTGGKQTALVGQLAQAGYTFPFDISGLVKDAIKNGGGDPFSYFYAKLIQSPQFNHYYPGIKRADGTLIMSPAQYQSYKDGVMGAAAKQGFKINSQQVGNLIKNQVSADEFQFRLEAAARIRGNKQLFQSMQQMGIHIHSAQDAFNFLTGKAPKAVYDTYEAATFKAAAESAGVGISAHHAGALAQSTVGITDMDTLEKSYQDIAQQLRDAGVELSAYGLQQKDLETIQFGGANRAALASRAQQALAQRQAAIGTTQTQETVSLRQGRPVAGEEQAASE